MQRYDIDNLRSRQWLGLIKPRADVLRPLSPLKTMFDRVSLNSQFFLWCGLTKAKAFCFSDTAIARVISAEFGIYCRCILRE